MIFLLRQKNISKTHQNESWYRNIEIGLMASLILFNKQQIKQKDIMLNPRSQYQNIRTFSSKSIRQSSDPDEIAWNPNANLQAHKNSPHKIDLTQVFNAIQLFSKTDVVQQTQLTYANQLSQQLGAQIWLKREDTQPGRTFKIRGAYYQYRISDEQRRNKGYCIVSDGNFASSYALIAGMFQTKCTLFVPTTCHVHKLASMRKEGRQFVEIVQVADSFEECLEFAKKYSEEHDMPILKSFQTLSLLHGFATIAKEIVDARTKKGAVDYILVPAGGGGLTSSIASVIKQISPGTKVIAVEPQTCKPYSSSILKGSMVNFDKACRFCNGSSVKQTSKTAFNIGRTSVDGFIEVKQRKIAQNIINLYSQGYICEASGALSVTGLDKIRHLIKGKTVVCILSGANIDLVNLDEARQMAMVSKGIKNHFQFRLPNRKNVIFQLMTKCFKESDIISISYSQKFGKEESQAVLSVQSQTQDDVEEYLQKLVENKYQFENINQKEDMLEMFF